MSLDSVLLIGGSGFLGLHLIQQFFNVSPRPDIHVFDLRPLPEKLPKCFTFTAADITFHQGDITSPDDVLSAIIKSKCDVIVHSASPVHGQRQEIYEKVNVEGTANVIKVAQKAKVKALVYTSSAGVIFNGQDIINADESWPIPEVPMDGYNKTKAEAEEMVIKANSKDFLTVALRPAGIFGPGDRQLVPGLRQVAALGQSKFQIGDNNNLFDWTYAGNVADAHVLAAQQVLDPKKQNEIGGEVFFVTNDAPNYFWTLARTVWMQDGHVEKYNIVLKRPIAILAGYLSQFFSKLSGKEPGLTPFRVKVVCAIRYHNISKIKRVMGYVPRVDLKEGIQATLDWMDEDKN
ncbi:CYFA0S05e04786g1_1 [Cyberlindnera fabianii]|uniref:Sterol-4-alpha-carboxylate 3-dehydrogenase ERG26, decarboxylating n=1 Tax=Cyberlindnera fabianii TaxID=36022 RepID=A0A061AT43_CYBFA|nr:CYFA0S05e04786g1_1 [Cyberlindnera fabianii]